MKLAVVVSTGDGWQKLEPNHFGAKIEFIARGCGQFRDRELVEVLSCAYDTKPQESRRGARFIRVRHLTDTAVEQLLAQAEGEESPYEVSLGMVVAGVEEDALRVTGKLFLSLGHNGPSGLIHEDDLRLQRTELQYRAIDWLPSPKIRDLRHTASGQWLFLPTDAMHAEVLSSIFGFDVALEQEQAKQRQAETAAAWKAQAAEEAERWSKEKERRVALFLAAYPAAHQWFADPPSWADITREVIQRKIARFVRRQRAQHYASFSKEYDVYEHVWELQIGCEKFELVAGSSIDYE